MQARHTPGPLEGFGADTNPFGTGRIVMITTKSLLAATLLSGFAAVSFAQAPAAPDSPRPMARHHEHHHHHHRHHGHHHGHRHQPTHHHHDGAAPHPAR